jgi:polysaccharide transporter, PST family
MPESRQTSVLAGAAFTVSMRWSDRLIGLVSTLILARLLVPADLGIIAMGSLVIGLANVLFELGVGVALIQNRDAEQSHYDTAWTIRLLQSTLTAIVIAVAAPFAGDYFGDPRVVPVVQVMAVRLILGAFENIGVVTFQKNLQFGLDFRFMFLKRFAGFAVTMVLAWLMRSYWALVIGSLVGSVFGVVLSYLLHPMRPKLGLQRFREIFSVSQWMLVRSIGMYLDNNLHQMLVGRRAGTSVMGGYSVASQISAMPSSELLSPLNRVLFPAFVQVRSDLGELKRMFLLAQGVQTLIGIPAAVGLALVAREATVLFLGERWLLAVPFVQILAITHVVQAISTSGGYVMITLDGARNLALRAWFQVGVFVLGALLIEPHSAISIAALRLGSVWVGLLLTLRLLLKTLENLTVVDLGRTISRPLIGAGLMAATILAIFPHIELPLLVALTLKIAAGIVVYCTAVMAMWRLAGRPDGAETYLLEKAAWLLRKRAAHR